ncbi:LysR family transcriptional regulator [Glutamicibacter sp. NPDC087344]|uniref:LysR family transcriptional regulator n=1 Tax=Glutamicibacter sp. NPDC087344 TaxID=3363994 RepID=UPI00381B1933
MGRDPLQGSVSLPQLEAVIAIVDHGSFTAAAEVLGISQSSLSRRIHALEQSLALPVFEPVGREMALTDIGRSIVPSARRALREVAAIGTVAFNKRSLITGSLRIAGLPSLVAGVMPAYLGEFHRQHPGIRLEIISVEDHEELVESLRLNRVDLAFGVNHQIPSDLLSRSIGEQKFAAVVAQDMDLASGGELTVEALNSLTLVTLPQGTSIRKITDEVYRRFHATAPRIITTTQRDALVNLSVAIGGITFVPEPLANTASVSGGRQLQLDHLATRKLGVFYREAEIRNPALRVFLENL